MQPLKLIILGDYWDSQIYKGRLYIWDMDNIVYIYDWERFVGNLAEDTYLKLPFTCAFSRGDLLYQPSDISQLIFEDVEIKQILERKFQAIAQRELVFSRHELSPYLIGEQDSPFDNIHDDSTIYNDAIFAITDSGLYNVATHKPKRQRYKIDKNPSKIWDGLGTSIQAGKSVLAIASGSEGLFEYNFNNKIEPKQISKRHTLFANWAFASIYGSSDIQPSYLAAFRWREQEREENLLGARILLHSKYIREFSSIMTEEKIFNQLDHEVGLSWGRQEKLYRASKNSLEVVHFTQKKIGSEEKEESPFEVIGTYPLNMSLSSNSEQVIAGGVSYFGVIVELEKGLMVIESTGSIMYIPGPITRWRVFPRSVRYENQLHVILDDRLEIHSFNNDYFVNQRNKIIGLEYHAHKISSKK